MVTDQHPGKPGSLVASGHIFYLLSCAKQTECAGSVRYHSDSRQADYCMTYTVDIIIQVEIKLNTVSDFVKMCRIYEKHNNNSGGAV